MPRYLGELAPEVDRATFLPGPDAPTDLLIGVEAEVTLFDDSSGARLWLADKLEEARAQVDAAGDRSSGLTEREVTEIDAKIIDPNAYWIRDSGFEPGETLSLSVDNQVLFRIDGVTVFLRVDVVAQGVSDRSFFAIEFAQLAQLLRERLTAEVAGGD